jgi:hypothetical protein
MPFNMMLAGRPSFSAVLIAGEREEVVSDMPLGIAADVALDLVLARSVQVEPWVHRVSDRAV